MNIEIFASQSHGVHTCIMKFGIFTCILIQLWNCVVGASLS